MSELWDAPNQQAVRPDESAPWEEGAGGSEQPGVEPTASEPEPEGERDLDAMTKDELLEVARERGVSPANATMTKDEIRESIEAA